MEQATPQEVARVAELLGRAPSGDFSVVVRDGAGDPVVIRNAPFLADGTPMPTRYWLVGRVAQEAVGRLESAGAVDEIESLFDPEIVAATHARYAEERDGLIDVDYEGPRPSGGVGGTRRGLKCLHAHLAWYLAGGGDPVGRYVATLLAGKIPGPVASIDCGTNSTRLLVIGPSGETLAREMTITRLGAGVDRTGHLEPEAIVRTLEVLTHYRQLLDRYGVVAARATTTSAARDADNRADLLDAALSVLGFPLELLSGEEEGRLSYLGATAGILADESAALVIDLGGGSTEFALGERDNLTAVASLNMGCVRVSERFLRSDPPTAEELAAGRRMVADLLGELIERTPAIALAPLTIGVAGTIATIATRALGLSTYRGSVTHNSVIDHAFVREEFALLASLTAAERRALPGIEVARADVIVGGLLILDEVMRALRITEITYSETDILDGLARSLLAN